MGCLEGEFYTACEGNYAAVVGENERERRKHVIRKWRKKQKEKDRRREEERVEKEKMCSGSNPVGLTRNGGRIRELPGNGAFPTPLYTSPVYL